LIFFGLLGGLCDGDGPDEVLEELQDATVVGRVELLGRALTRTAGNRATANVRENFIVEGKDRYLHRQRKTGYQELGRHMCAPATFLSWTT
jgi:hypothetical protein